jgi:hypothetical protein
MGLRGWSYLWWFALVEGSTGWARECVLESEMTR